VVPANAAGLIDHVLAAGVTDRRPGTLPTTVTSRGQVPGGHAYTRTCYQDPTGTTVAECWTIHQGGHSWSGGVASGSYTDPRGPDASAEFIRLFDAHPAPGRPAGNTGARSRPRGQGCRSPGEGTSPEPGGGSCRQAAESPAQGKGGQPDRRCVAFWVEAGNRSRYRNRRHDLLAEAVNW
jgi:hypothetical protein